MKEYEPTQQLNTLMRGRVHKSLAREYYRKHGRGPESLYDLYKGLGFTLSQVREAEQIRLLMGGISPIQIGDVVDANMHYWGKHFY